MFYRDRQGVYRANPGLDKHLSAVRKYSTRLARAMKKAGIEVDVDVVSKAAAMHDVAINQQKFRKFGTVMDTEHEQLAKRLLVRTGFRRVGQVVGEHGDPGGHKQGTGPERVAEMQRMKAHTSVEGQVLDYVDSRTAGDVFGSLDEKLGYCIAKYGNWENLPRHMRNPKEYIQYITGKFGELQKFEDWLKSNGIDPDAVVRRKR